MRIKFIDPVLPMGVPGHKEAWDGGGKGFNEHEILAATALVQRGHEVIIFGQTDHSFTEAGVGIEPFPKFLKYKADAIMFFLGHSSKGKEYPWQFGDEELLKIVYTIQGPVLAFGYTPVVSPPNDEWITSGWGYLALSRWQEQYLLKRGMPKDRLYHVSQPLHLDNMFDPQLVKRPQNPRCLYASSWDRGLEDLLVMWKRINTQVPEAELYVCYNDAPEDAKEYFRPWNIYFAGNLGFKDMKSMYHRCHFLLYPCTEDVEAHCCTVEKAQLAGCVPIVTPKGSLPELIVQNGGIVADRFEYVDVTLSVLEDVEEWGMRSEKCMTYMPTSMRDYAVRLEDAWEDVRRKD